MTSFNKILTWFQWQYFLWEARGYLIHYEYWTFEKADEYAKGLREYFDVGFSGAGAAIWKLKSKKPESLNENK